jgi:hypothetical protein
MFHSIEWVRISWFQKVVVALPLPGGEGWGEGEPLSLFFATNYSVQLLPFFSGHIDYLESTTVLTLRFRKSKSFA